MLKKNKYEVMAQEIKKSMGSGLKLLIDAYKLFYKAKAGKATEEEISIETAIFLERIIPLVKIVAHMAYENGKDLEKIDPATLFEYLGKKNVTPAQFSFHYNKNLTAMTKALVIFATIEKSGIKIPSLKDPEFALKILNGTKIEDFAEELLGDVDLEVFEKIEYIFEEDVSLSELDEETKQLIEDYHVKYMDENIYPKVKYGVVSEGSVLKLAKKLAKPKAR